MAISYVGVSSQFSGGASGTITLPAGIANNDIILAHVTTAGDNVNVFTTPAGWTEVGAVQAGVGGTFPRHTVLRATYNSGSPPTLTFNITNLNHHVGFTTAWRGVDTTTVLDVAALLRSNNGTTTSHSETGPTTVTNDAMVVMSGGHAEAVTVTMTSQGNLASITEAADYSTTFGNDGSAFGAYGLKTTAGAVGTITWTASAASTSAAVFVALRPASGGALAPDPITTLSGTAGNAQVALTWTAPANNGAAITDYAVESRATTGVVREEFTGTNNTSWDSAKWESLRTSTGSGSRNIQTNRGRITIGSANYAHATSTLIEQASNLDLSLSYATLDVEEQYPQICFRIGNYDSLGYPENGYIVEISPSFNVVKLIEVVGAASKTTLAEVTTAGVNTTARRFVRVQAIGSALKVKWWLTTLIEPSTWQIEVTDATYTTGDVSLGMYNGNSLTNRSVDYDDLLLIHTSSNWTSFSDGVSASTGATVTSLTNGTGYLFRAAAINSVGQAAWSNIPGPYTPSAGGGTSQWGRCTSPGNFVSMTLGRIS